MLSSSEKGVRASASSRTCGHTTSRLPTVHASKAYPNAWEQQVVQYQQAKTAAAHPHLTTTLLNPKPCPPCDVSSPLAAQSINALKTKQHSCHCSPAPDAAPAPLAPSDPAACLTLA